MRYISTSSPDSGISASFAEAVAGGLAHDGGLYIPEDIPRVPKAVFMNMAGMNTQEIAYLVMDTLIGRDLGAEQVRRINEDALTFDIPAVAVDGNTFAIELFHGPTGNSKDIGARYMARILRELNKETRPRVIASLSSDSGIAIADAFNGLDGFDTFVVFPRGRINPKTRRRLLDMGSNIHPVEVRGSADDCLAMIRTALIDSEFKQNLSIAGANSINIARLLPTAIQYFAGWAGMVAKGADPAGIVMAVPCANLGNLCGALLAVRMGLPVKRLVAASNANDTAVRALRGESIESPRQIRTVAPAMDVARPLNLPRALAMAKGLPVPLQAYSSTDEEIMACRDSLAAKGYNADPHSCVSAAALAKSVVPGECGAFLATTAHTPALPEDSPYFCRDTISPTYMALKRIISTV